LNFVDHVLNFAAAGCIEPDMHCFFSNAVIPLDIQIAFCRSEDIAAESVNSERCN
jgi:hypothetical protein